MVFLYFLQWICFDLSPSVSNQAIGKSTWINSLEKIRISKQFLSLLQCNNVSEVAALV